jgi:hypothetical protein
MVMMVIGYPGFSPSFCQRFASILPEYFRHDAGICFPLCGRYSPKRRLVSSQIVSHMPDSYRNFASIFLALIQYFSGDILASSLETTLSLQQGRGVADKNGKAAGGLLPRHGWAATRPDVETSKRPTGGMAEWLNHPRAEMAKPASGHPPGRQRGRWQ